MERPPLTIPAGDGVLACEPAYDRWADVVAANRKLATGWDFCVAGVPVEAVRSLARHEALKLATVAAERIDGTAPGGERDEDAPLVLTGHQPLLHHPGVWSKVMLAAGLAEKLDGTAIECVVDTDAFDRIALTVPCGDPDLSRCTADLVTAPGEEAYFASSPAPGDEQIDAFEVVGSTALASLGIPAISERLHAFVRLLRGTTAARDAAEAVTAARRAWERPLDLGYLPLPVTDQAGGEAFALFVADVALRAVEFRDVYNERLAAYRQDHGVRSAVRPFPDLGHGEDGVELPLWHLDGVSRARVWARAVESGSELRSRGATLAVVREGDRGSAVSAVAGVFAPKAVALTMFNRCLVSDVFIHGAGGAAYDVVTDGIVSDFWGVVPPAYVSATLTMRLPIEVPSSPDALIAELQQRLHTLEHNPDRLLASGKDVPPGASALAAEKAGLVERIAIPGADKKALGSRIREVNRALAEFAEPIARRTRDELSRAEQEREVVAVLRDRTYPFFLWDPVDVRSHLP